MGRISLSSKGRGGIGRFTRLVRGLSSNAHGLIEGAMLDSLTFQNVKI